jgi:hypothetical protein
MQGGDENSSDAMGTLVANSDKIRHATGAHLLWVHHSGKVISMGMRGSSVLLAAVDTPPCRGSLSNQTGWPLSRKPWPEENIGSGRTERVTHTHERLGPLLIYRSLRAEV